MLGTRQQWLDAHAPLQHQEGFAQLICQTQCWKPEKLRISGDVMHKRYFFIFNNQTRVFLCEAHQPYIPVLTLFASQDLFFLPTQFAQSSLLCF